MKRSRGFGTIPFMGYLVAAAGAAIVVLMVLLWGQTQRLESAQQTLSTISKMGEEAQKRVSAQIRRDRLLKEKSDESYKKTLASLATANRRLQQSASGSSLPAPETPAAIPVGICFKREELDRAIRTFTAGTAAIASEGDGYFARLINAHEWATVPAQ